jgi:hypothetical protein
MLIYGALEIILNNSDSAQTYWIFPVWRAIAISIGIE